MAGEINIARYDNNEILHKDDLQYGETRAYENLTSIIKRFTISTKDAIVQGGIVKERGTPSMNVDIESLLAFCVSTGKFAYYGSDFGPVAITNGGAQSRIDTLEIRLKETNFDELQRAYKDPNTGDITYQDWMTKIHYEMEAQVIQGTEGAGVAPNHTSGWIKIAEIDVDAGESTSILNADIHNVTAGYDTEVNSGWTAETAVTFRSKALTEIKEILRAKHKEDGDHADDVIRATHIDWGSGAGEVDADLMPLGTTITHAPTGGSNANLTASSTMRQAVQKILDLLIDLSGVENDAIDDRHVNWGANAGEVDADLMPLGTTITHAPTGGTAANLTSTSTVREAVQKILDLLINLSGVQNDAVLSRHINADAVVNEHIGPAAVRETEIDLGIDAGDVDADVLPLGTAVTSSPTGGTNTNLANTSFVRAALQVVFNRLIDLSGVENDAVDERHVNWGTGAGQVSAADLPIADSKGKYASSNTEGALGEVQATKLVAKSANYTILDNDGVSVIDMTTGATDKTATLPTAADNVDRDITLRKADSAAGKAILDGEGAETINGTLIWEITEQHGYVKVKSNGTGWVVLAQEGCIYEMWDVGNYLMTTSWVDYYNLSGLTPGKYLIEYGLLPSIQATSQFFATIATAVDTLDDDNYTLYIACAATQTIIFLTKSFYRTFASATTLYLNAKKVAVAAVNIDHSTAGYPHGYIRATRVA